MASGYQSSAIEKTPEEQRFEVITNIVKMLVERRVMNGLPLSDMVKTYKQMPIDIMKTDITRDTHARKIASKIISNLKDDNTCVFAVDNPPENDSKNYKIIFMVDQKISNVSKSSVIGDYLFKNQSEHKIIVVSEIAHRPKQVILSNYPLVEVFTIDELMINLADYIYQPIFALMSADESKAMLDEYMLKKKELPWIFVTDPIARYYKATIGQIFKIYRTSETSGLSVYYRVVIRKIVQKTK